jgi:N-acetylmuramoyl-L-alanine amidase
MRALLAAVLAALLAPAAAAAAPPFEVERVGDPAAPLRVLVVGSIHGNETAGHAIVRRLARREPPAGVQLWLVETANPDGVRRGTRQNARGVDLNRNFPFRWAGGGRPFDTYFPGRAPASERETRGLMALAREVQPDLTLHYHQHMRLVVLPRGADRAPVRDYARRVGLPARRLPRLRGTAISWQNRRVGGTAFVVELPAGSLSARAARRHARAVHAIAAAARSATTTSAPAARAPKPALDWDPIPFGADRKAQMRRYSRRHYGVAKARLVDPKVIVQHYTASTTYASAFNTFAANAPDVEFGERPGVCAHYVIERDGTIHQLVSLRWRCRHTVGLNDTAIGIEHVGVSDGDVMGRPAQLAASLRLTRWLQGRFGIRTRDVIGHAESLSSPYHHERVAAMRDRTHGDFQPATMRRYRARL